MKRWRKVIALFLLAVLVTVGCGSGKEKMETEVQSENEALNQEGRTQPEELNEPEDVPVEGTEVDKSVYMDAGQDVEIRIEALLAQMTLEEKVAQMVQPERMEFGQEVEIISNGVAYRSILTGRERGKNTKLVFGTVRLDLTKILRRSGNGQ